MITTDFERLSWYRLIFIVLVATYICLGREGNVITHSLARYAIDISDFFMWMEDVPPQFHFILQADLDGLR